MGTTKADVIYNTSNQSSDSIQVDQHIISTNKSIEESRKRKADPILTDLLKRGEKALSQLKLLTPVEDNANMYYQAALGREPSNAQAIYGLAQIVTYYTDFAWRDAQKQQFYSAQKNIELANLVNPNDPLIEETQKRISDFRKKLMRASHFNSGSKATISKKTHSPNAFFLPKTLFSLSEEEIIEQLQPIIDRVAVQQAVIEINWINDKEARLLYQIINSRIPDFRVRGMIFHRSSYMIEVKQQ
ncbi:hypothetical protein O1D97_15005 [Marinomonas sp. 15G1-11]|uniref:tRNA nuclease CdiA C-terminal domain-containing protein n=1 Tax=Marinomonas phaeophyticola TaxID=3004091 RepID=A0ABT4JXV3_9GAMM|nr:hypothetical protein [Marinomonas sp. 15G1-11]MCZ2722882.1 hypothetical protein [Marinomonas sp. 15G1-11]